MKPMVFFIRKKLRKNQNGPLKKAHFPVLPIFIFLKKKFQGLVLGLVGLIDEKGIDFDQPMWP